MPVRSLTQSVLRWPDPERLLLAVRQWAEQQAECCHSLRKVGVFGSYGRGDATVGSDLDLLIVDVAATGAQWQRLQLWPLEQLPLSCDALVLMPEEFERRLGRAAHWYRMAERFALVVDPFDQPAPIN